MRDGRQRDESLGGEDLPVGERHLVQPDRIRLLLVIAVLLVVDGDAIPSGRSWSLVIVQRCSLTVQRDRLKQKMIVRCSLRLNDKVVPRIVHGIARYPGGMPLLAWIIPDVPFIPSGDAAFVSPDEGLTIDELIDIELQRLRSTYIGRVEIDVVGEVMDVGNDGVIRIGQTLR